jgi:hypothetical protein
LWNEPLHSHEKLKNIHEILEKVHRDKTLTRTQLWAIIKKAKEGKPAVAVWRHLGAPTFIAGITAEVEKDQQETRSGSWVDDQTNSSTLDKDLKLSKKLARWWRQLKGKEMKKERV